MTSAVGRPGQVPLRDAAASWPVVSSAEQARGPVVTLRSDQVRMPDGDVVPRQVVQHPGAVAVVALDEAGRVLLIRQYRHPVGRLLWEIPAGLRDVEGEPLHATAARELVEETGYAAADWQVLADYFSSPGISTERIRVFLARELRRVPDEERNYVASHEEAQLMLRWVDLATAVDRFIAGDLHNGVTAVGILSAYAARCGGFTGLRPVDAPGD
ncbi:MAG: NUDIX domain-containing protein [Streptosporangiaceae bacterium]